MEGGQETGYSTIWSLFDSSSMFVTCITTSYRRRLCLVFRGATAEDVADERRQQRRRRLLDALYFTSHLLQLFLDATFASLSCRRLSTVAVYNITKTKSPYHLC